MTERAVLFGDTGALVGVLTEAEDGFAREARVAVVLINAGVVHHVGPHRMYVELARRLATSGFFVLRFDHSGIGDSPARADHLAFEQSSVLEVHDAMSWLERECGCERFVLVGLCSGTLTAFRSAIRDRRVIGLALMTALLEDPSAVSAEVIQQAMDRRIARSYTTEKAFALESWWKLVTGRANYRQIARVLAKRIRSRLAPAPEGTPRDSEVAIRMGELLDRGVAVVFIFAEPTTVLEYFRMTLEPSWKRLRERGNLDLHVVQHSDHTFSTAAHRERIVELLEEWLRDAVGSVEPSGTVVADSSR